MLFLLFAGMTRGACLPAQQSASVVAKPLAPAIASELPDAPDAAPQSASMWSFDQPQEPTDPQLPACPANGVVLPANATPGSQPDPPLLCAKRKDLRSVVDSNQFGPLTSRQKGVLAVREVIDPFNLIALTGQAGISVAANAHSAYGPGLKGFGKLTGYALLGDATGAFFGVYAVPSLTHMEPRYRRMQNASISRRLVHAIVHTVVAQSDSGRTMPNYATLATYPITAELANLYVPGVQSNGPDTARRILAGLATDPVGNIVAEFLPDLARHIHIRAVFIQQILNQVAFGTMQGPSPGVEPTP